MHKKRPLFLEESNTNALIKAWHSTQPNQAIWPLVLPSVLIGAFCYLSVSLFHSTQSITTFLMFFFVAIWLFAGLVTLLILLFKPKLGSRRQPLKAYNKAIAFFRSQNPELHLSESSFTVSYPGYSRTVPLSKELHWQSFDQGLMIFSTFGVITNCELIICSDDPDHTDIAKLCFEKIGAPVQRVIRVLRLCPQFVGEPKEKQHVVPVDKDKASRDLNALRQNTFLGFSKILSSILILTISLFLIKNMLFIINKIVGPFVIYVLQKIHIHNTDVFASLTVLLVVLFLAIMVMLSKRLSQWSQKNLSFAVASFSQATLIYLCLVLIIYITALPMLTLAVYFGLWSLVFAIKAMTLFCSRSSYNNFIGDHLTFSYDENGYTKSFKYQGIECTEFKPWDSVHFKITSGNSIQKRYSSMNNALSKTSSVLYFNHLGILLMDWIPLSLKIVKQLKSRKNT
ncbi:MAG: hypothetical protein ACON5A_01415 [Candidatus Comchoanobacterales bacterium]